MCIYSKMIIAHEWQKKNTPIIDRFISISLWFDTFLSFLKKATEKRFKLIIDMSSCGWDIKMCFYFFISWLAKWEIFDSFAAISIFYLKRNHQRNQNKNDFIRIAFMFPKSSRSFHQQNFIFIFISSYFWAELKWILRKYCSSCRHCIDCWYPFEFFFLFLICSIKIFNANDKEIWVGNISMNAFHNRKIK